MIRNGHKTLMDEIQQQLCTPDKQVAVFDTAVWPHVLSILSHMLLCFLRFLLLHFGTSFAFSSCLQNLIFDNKECSLLMRHLHLLHSLLGSLSQTRAESQMR
ncbi:hypothetical protein IC582_029902 [Cucumis melo]